MYKIIWIFITISIVSCSQDCLESPGQITRQEITLDAFEGIIVGRGIQLTIKEDTVQQVIIETGENRQDNVHFNIQNGILEIYADDLCMLSGTFAPAKIFISSPNISSIRNASENTVSSDGILTFSELTLLVEDYESDYLNVGDFDLQLDNQRVEAVSNGIANIYLNGQTNFLSVKYYNGIGRFEGENLIAQKVFVFHRAENSIKVNPQQSLTGNIYSIGDVISYNHPPIVSVIEHYEGQLIFY
jgi:hypothetical protein